MNGSGIRCAAPKRNCNIGESIPALSGTANHTQEYLNLRRRREMMRDYAVEETLKDFVEGRDAAKEYVYQLVKA